MTATSCFHGPHPPRTRWRIPRGLPLLIASLIALASPAVLAGEVRRAISARETYVGLPITLQVQFANVEQHVPPELPSVDGLTIRSAGAPRATQPSHDHQWTTYRTGIADLLF